MNIEERIKFVKEEEMYWDWDTSQPSYYDKTPNSKHGGIYNKFDPFPCYTHNKDLIFKEVQKIESLFPIEFDTFYFIFPYECISRTNGQSYTNTIQYKTETKKHTWDGVIDLYGKRIPIHPSMTRYLVSHEYGHVIDNYICNCRDLDQDGMDEEYAKMRGIECNKQYGGRKWHTNIGEIIVNDFRICIGNTEIEFWPHEVEHPLNCPNVIEFWKEMKEKYSYKGDKK